MTQQEEKELEAFLHAEQFAGKPIHLPNGKLLIMGKQGRCYKDFFSIFMVQVVNLRIVYESHEQMFRRKADAKKTLDLLSKVLTQCTMDTLKICSTAEEINFKKELARILTKSSENVVSVWDEALQSTSPGILLEDLDDTTYNGWYDELHQLAKL